MESKVITFRDLTGNITKELQMRVDQVEAISDIARRDMQRYYTLLRLSMPTFSEAEATLIADALNGVRYDEHTVSLFWAGIADAINLNGLDKKWDVDGNALIERLRMLTPFESLAVIDAAERFWSGPYYQEGPMRDKLLAVGLLKPERKGL